MNISREWVEEVRAKLPELPEEKRNRFMSEYNLPKYDADLLTRSRLMANYFDKYMQLEPHKSSPNKAKTAKDLANWVLGEFSRLLNATNTEINNSKVTPDILWRLIDLKERGVISNPIAKEVFAEMYQSGRTADEIIKERGLSQISDTGELEKIALEVINSNTQPVADYRAGKETALKFLVGQVMKATRGQANPQVVNEVLKKTLDEKK
jgi:aspartyl-tRNA(Asn)/glutamyl-tRNA(Gln) amidotransferase subunit B